MTREQESQPRSTSTCNGQCQHLIGAFCTCMMLKLVPLCSFRVIATLTIHYISPRRHSSSRVASGLGDDCQHTVIIWNTLKGQLFHRLVFEDAVDCVIPSNPRQSSSAWRAGFYSSFMRSSSLWYVTILLLIVFAPAPHLESFMPMQHAT